MQGGQLQRSFGLGFAIILVISNIIGSGIFKKIAPMSEALGSPVNVLLAWVLGGLVTIFGVLCAAEAASMFPESGGPYAWLSKMYGRQIGFLYGWACFTIIQGATVASIAVVFGQALDSLVSLPRMSAEWESYVLLDNGEAIRPFADLGSKFVSILLIWLLTFINIRGAKFSGNVSRLTTYTLVAAIAIIIVLSFTSAKGNFTNFTTVSTAYPTKFFADNSFAFAMILAMRSTFWAYEGWISLGYIGQEIKEPQRNLPKALILGILGVITIYLLTNLAYMYAMPIDELLQKTSTNPEFLQNLYGMDTAAATQMATNNGGKIAAVVVMDSILGNSGAILIAMLIMVSTFGCTNITILGASRIYNAMAIKGEFFENAAKIHPTYHTPHISLLMQAVWTSLLVLSGSFDFLTNLLVFAAFIFYGLVAAGVIVLRYKMPDVPRPYRTFGYPVVPIVFVGFCLILVGVAAYQNWQNSLLGVVLILSGLPFYYYWTGKNTQ